MNKYNECELLSKVVTDEVWDYGWCRLALPKNRINTVAYEYEGCVHTVNKLDYDRFTIEYCDDTDTYVICVKYIGENKMEVTKVYSKTNMRNKRKNKEHSIKAIILMSFVKHNDAWV